MIDTNKYEGHTEYRRDKLGTYAGTDIYVWSYFAQELPNWVSKADFLLVEDAPKLLAEVKRLREQVADLQDTIDCLREFCHKEGYDTYNWEVKYIPTDKVIE